MKYNKVWNLVAAAPIIILFSDCYQVSKVQGHSMRPTLNPTDSQNDWVLIKKWKFMKNLKVNDIVLIKSPIDCNISLCKRIKAVEGDRIVVPQFSEFGKLIHLKTIVIPKGHVWIQGDNVHSLDSKNFGPISKGLIEGRIIKVIWPPRRVNSNLYAKVGLNVRKNQKG